MTRSHSWDQGRSAAREDRRRTRRRGLLFLLPVLTIWLATGLLAAPASAGTYSVWSCADGSGNPLPAAEWQPSQNGPGAFATSSCNATGGSPRRLSAVVYVFDGNPVDVFASFTISAPAFTAFSGIDIWWRHLAGATYGGSIQIFSNSSPTPIYYLPGGTFGSDSDPLGAGNLQSFAVPAASRVSLLAVCNGPVCTRTSNGLSALFNAYRVRMRVTDASAPTGQATGLADGRVMGDAVPVDVQAADVGAGMRRISLAVDGQDVAGQEPGGPCADVDPSNSDPYEYAVTKPCPDTLAGTLQLDPSKIGKGQHTVRVNATDAAGNTTTLLTAKVRGEGGGGGGDGEVINGAKCSGKAATIVGTKGRDVIQGTKKDDVIASLDGNDKVRGSAGKDLICAGDGKDKLRGEKGNDTLLGGAGRDKLRGGPGRDKLRGGPGRDKLRGGPGHDSQHQ